MRTLQPSVDVCDGIDSDCDGQVDEVGAEYCSNNLAHVMSGDYIPARCVIVDCIKAWWMQMDSTTRDANEIRGAEQCNGSDDDCDSRLMKV